MKIISSVGFALLLSAATFTANAQAKFGHINSAELVADMTETKQADETLKKYTEDIQGQFTEMSQELQKKYTDYQARVATMSDAIKEIRAKEIQDLQTRIEDFQQSAQENISKKKEELYGPILKRAEIAVKDVAKEGKYAYIFDTSIGTVIYAQPSDDVMGAVRKKLGMPAAAPATGSR